MPTTQNKNSNKYFEAVGRRKTAVARVRLFKSTSAENDMEINDQSYKKYFVLPKQRQTAIAPLELLSLKDKMKVTAKVAGGGISSQAEAVRHGISRAIVLMDEENRKRLRRAGFMTRDPRMVERKKYGLKKARRAPQWKKR